MPSKESPSKLHSKLHAKREARKSPVSKDQATVPLADAMVAYHERDMLSFAIPAHNGGRGPAPKFTEWLAPQAARFDLACD
jgi:hypothetical protein